MFSFSNVPPNLQGARSPCDPHGYTGGMSLLVGLVLLPFFVWAWITRGADEDSAAALSIAAWIVIGASAAAALWYAFG